MKSNQKFVLFGLILVAVVAAIFAFRSGKDFGREALLSPELYYELSDASEDLKDLDDTMDRVRQVLFDEVKSFRSTVGDSAYSVTAINVADNTVSVFVSCSIFEHKENDPISFTYTDASGFRAVPAVYSDGMFSAILPLPIDQICEIGYITGTSELNNEVFLTLDARKVLYDRFRTRVDSSSDYDPNAQKETGTINISMSNDYGDNELLKFVSCRFQIIVEDTVISETDMTSWLADWGDQYLLMLDLTSDEVRGITYDWDTGNYENYPNIYKKYRLIGTDGYGYEYTLDITNINVVNEDNIPE